jgi:soluble lytic murein transglycosylase-like protein
LRLSKLAILLGIFVSFAGFGGSASAQESPAPANKPGAEVSTVVPQTQTPAPAVPKVSPPTTAAEPKPSASDAASSAKSGQASAVDSYKTSLNSLSALYQTEVQKLEKQNEQLKGLFKDGLVSRVELDGSDKALADARTKVEDVARQIAEANKPAPVVNVADASQVSLAGNQLWSTGNIQVDNLIRFYGKQHGVDPYLIFCLMSQESKFSKGAISPKGAQGLMQLMPGTAARYGVTNPYDVGQNISGGTRYLKDLLKMFNGRVDLALAGYNAGENAVIKYGYSIPPYDETRNYVKLIIKRYGRITTAEPKTKS